MNISIVRILALCMCLAYGASAWAQSGTDRGASAAGIPWLQLSPEQRELVGGTQEQWSQLPPGRQIALSNGAKRFLRMDARQRELANRRFEQWNGMTDEERSAISSRYTEFRALTPRERARIRRASRRFETLPPEQRQQLRQRFQDLAPAERVRAREQLRQRPRLVRPKK
ncbi:MAG TPA: DUF3106 domain-containing protein [Steroidobacteraceae bacterium]|nr:DUF3106 domain-containing protein [Steroidobacteraceae bacterium]